MHVVPSVVVADEEDDGEGDDEFVLPPLAARLSIFVNYSRSFFR